MIQASERQGWVPGPNQQVIHIHEATGETEEQAWVVLRAGPLSISHQQLCVDKPQALYC